MSLRERLRRKGNAATGSDGKNASAPPPAPADVADRTTLPADPDEAAAAIMSALEVEVPIDLSTELLLAAAISKSPADKATPSAGPMAGAAGAREAGGGGAPLSAVDQLKLDVHRRLIDRLDLEALEKITDERQLTVQIREAVTEFLRAENAPLSASEREEIVEQVVYEITGLGPIEPLFRDPTITDILVNGAKDIYVERSGKLSRVSTAFRNDAHLLTVIDRIVSRVGRRVDESSPMVDARLPDGSRVNAIIPPLALDGPVLSIRRFGSDLNVEALTASGTLTKRMATLLAGCVHARLNILISGGTGSGKTTLLNALSAFIPGAERVVTIEDAAELRLQQEHVVRLETRPPNVEGRGEVVARDLVRNALRMRPNRIIIGEVRGVEAVDMLQAMNTGHEGSMATIHANSPRDALSRLENMVMLAGTGLPMRALREQIAATVDVIVQIARLSDGTRRVVSITEITGVEGDVITTNEIFAFRRSGVVSGRVLGRFEATGVRPRFAERLQVAGVPLPSRLFDDAGGEGEDAVQPGADGTGSAALAAPGSPIPVTSPHDVGGADERHARVVKQLESTIRSLQAALEQEKRAAEGARAGVEEMRAQLMASRIELDTLRDEVRAAQYEADELRELQAALQQRSRSLAVAVMGFVELLDDVIRSGRESPDEAMRERATRLGDGVSRLLALFGLTEINGVGRPVDDALHEVVRRVPANGQGSGAIVEIVQRGFAYHGQTVRRAQVVAAS
jgi:pilus assembly protein CpaF